MYYYNLNPRPLAERPEELPAIRRVGVGSPSGKALRIHREILHERRMTGLHFWATGYWVSTVGLDEQGVRRYIREQEQLEAHQGDLDLK